MSTGCRDDALAVGEPLAGSAGDVAAWVGVAWPKPRWHAEDASLSAGLPPGLRELELGEKSAGRKLAIRAFQRDVRPSTQSPELIAFDPSRGRAEHAEGIEAAGLTAAVRRFLAGETIAPPLRRTTLLICTDGRHDRCCAAHGRPLLEAARREVDAAGLALDVVETSHLGGHRFAPTVLALPEGRLYGRLDASRAGELVRAVSQGGVLADADRGRLGADPIEQLLESAARARFPDTVGVGIVTREADGDDVVHVAIEVHRPCARESLVARCRRSVFESPGSCGEPAMARARWTLDEVR